MKDKYKQAFMCMAEIFAQTSEAQRLKVGGLIVKDDKIISQPLTVKMKMVIHSGLHNTQNSKH